MLITCTEVFGVTLLIIIQMGCLFSFNRCSETVAELIQLYQATRLFTTRSKRPWRLSARAVCSVEAAKSCDGVCGERGQNGLTAQPSEGTRDLGKTTPKDQQPSANISPSLELRSITRTGASFAIHCYRTALCGRNTQDGQGHFYSLEDQGSITRCAK
jgi:hypothetical protein